MQEDNQKLKKEIKAKIEKMGMMEDKLEEFSRKNKEAHDIITIYGALIGIYIERVPGRDRKYRITIYEKPGSEKKQFESTLEPKNTGKGYEEWHVHIDKLAYPSLLGLTAGETRIYNERTLGEFFLVLKEVAQLI